MSKSFYILLRIYLFCIFIISTNNTFAQDDVIIDNTKHIATYIYTYQEDSISNDKVKTDEMRLYLGAKYSKFEHSGRYSRDSLVRVYRNEEDQEAAFQKVWSIIQQMSTGGHFSKYKIIKNINNDNIIMCEGPVNKKDYLKVSETINQEWNLVYTSDTIICNLKCKKATTRFRNRDYTAWYAIEIPINDGPYKFKGLPGLIVKIEDKNSHHTFELDQFQEIDYNKPIYFDKNKYREVSMKDYFKVKKTALMRIAQYLNNPEKARNFGNSNMGEIEAKLLSKNNYIERY